MADTNYELEGYTGADIQHLLNFLASHKDYITYGRPFSDNNRDGVIAVDVPHVYLDNVTIAGSYMFWSGVTLHDGPNGDVSWGPTGLIVEVINKYDGVPSGQVATLKQTIFKVTTTEKNIYVRFRTAADTWTTWQQVLTSGDIDDSLSTSGKIADAGAVDDRFKKRVRSLYNSSEYGVGTSADLFVANGLYFASKVTDYPDGQILDLPFYPAWLEVTKANSSASNNVVLQVCYPYSTTSGYYPVMRTRNPAGNWSDWMSFINYSQLKKINYIHTDYESGLSADDYTQNGIYYSSTVNNVPQIADLPYQPAWLDVTRAIPSGSVVLQIVYPYDLAAYNPKMRICKASGEWTQWKDFGGGEPTVVTNEFEIIQNEYEVSASISPTVSGLPYVLTSTGDTTDRTVDIATMLSQYGSCQLGVGVFYVKDLTMPDNTSLFGSGASRTTLRLIDTDNTSDCYAVGVRSKCTLSDICLSGGLNARPKSLGKRHGLSYQGTYIDGNNPGTYPVRGQVYNLNIQGFSGSGILCTNTSGDVAAGLNVVNANILPCYNGIEIKNKSEYNRFANVGIVGCEFGVINNSGNTMFSNCGFNGCGVGFYIDNHLGDAYNDGHGSAVCCTFNHSGADAAGTSIKVHGCLNGYTFDGCQIHHGHIDIKDSAGIIISNCNIGYRVPISIDGGGVVCFYNDVFRGDRAVTKVNAPVVKSDNCYTFAGTTMTI